MTFGFPLSIATGRDCIGRIFHFVEMMPRINQSMYDVPINTSTTMYSTLPNHGCSCGSPMHTSRDMRPCTVTVCLIAVLDGGALPGSLRERQVGGKNSLLTSLRRRLCLVDSPRRFSFQRYRLRRS